MPYWSVTVTAHGRVTGFAEVVVEAANERQAREKAKIMARMTKPLPFQADDAGIEWVGPYDTDDVCFAPPGTRKKP